MPRPGPAPASRRRRCASGCRSSASCRRTPATTSRSPSARRRRARRPRRARCATASSRSSSRCSSACWSRSAATSWCPRVTGPRELSRLLDLPMLDRRPVRAPAPRPPQPAAVRDRAREPTRRSAPRCASRCRPSRRPARAPGHQRAARGGQEHGHRAPRPGARPVRPRHAAGVGRPALADAARARRGPRGPGLAELLSRSTSTARRDEIERLRQRLADPARPRPRRRASWTSCPSGGKPAEPAQLLAGPGPRRCSTSSPRLGYAYILVDAPPRARHRRHPEPRAPRRQPAVGRPAGPDHARQRHGLARHPRPASTPGRSASS